MSDLKAKVSLPSLAVAPQASDSDRDLFARHYRALTEYTDALREGRCRRTTRFTADLAITLRPFGPLFMAWNMEILFVLYMNGGQRFNAIKRMLRPISSRVLADKLAALQALGLLAHGGSVPAYDLTTKGQVVARHLHPLLFFLNASPRPKG